MAETKKKSTAKKSKVTKAKSTKSTVKKTTRKSTLEKYYISEKLIKKTNNIEFNFKKAKEKNFKTYSDFVDALNEFIKVSEASKNETRVWFHRNGAYRGSVDWAKAKIILERLSENKVENEQVIEYLEQENLVDKPESKKVEIVDEVTKSDLNEEATKVEFFVPNAQLIYANDITKDDIVFSTPEQDYLVNITNIMAHDDQLDIEYVLERSSEQSAYYVKTLSGFKSNEVVEEVISQPIIEQESVVEETSKSHDEELIQEQPVEEKVSEPVEKVEIVDAKKEEKPVVKKKFSKELIAALVVMGTLMAAAITILVLVAFKLI
ncbi:hypothetical protein NPA07_04530 [Mycoplasmopsis caviae]|uniref:Uncharacterized protein n=1 Tax=Mycoplasmopsis caviae TaxID=55603 RepID=A0A3P8LB02_9BACT|nr:hypothetical protein [Mycoplasmopsis caviae]UUD35043.1 hypothetical protein NPA07_04530 [Mycoplasmopsis caviae]VDR42131.1 Uncharacterised protein [Mycoplasmopsis caviae]